MSITEMLKAPFEACPAPGYTRVPGTTASPVNYPGHMRDPGMPGTQVRPGLGLLGIRR